MSYPLINPVFNMPIQPSSNIDNQVKDQQAPQSQFANFLNNALEQLNNVQKEADKSSMQLATGQVQDVHSVMIALEKANLSFSLAVEVRNKVLDAYREVMRMQI